VATNTANIINSGINVKHWFGVLVINVFGDWFGSVNDNTAAGNSIVGGKGSGSEVHAVAPLAAAVTRINSDTNTSPKAAISLPSSTTTVLGDTSVKKLAAIHNPILPTTQNSASHSQSYLLFGFSALIMLIAGVLAFFERRMKQI
jgi:hypothetical protein